MRQLVFLRQLQIAHPPRAFRWNPDIANFTGAHLLGGASGFQQRDRSFVISISQSVEFAKPLVARCVVQLVR